MKRCADQIDCGYENRDSDLFCRACALPLLNTALAGRYNIHALISKGGYAAVFLGLDQNLSRRIAMKFLLPSKTTQSEHEHFLREARIAAGLDHPNIGVVYEIGEAGGLVVLDISHHNPAIRSAAAHTSDVDALLFGEVLRERACFQPTVGW